MELITINFTNWHKFNPRKDFKNPHWFAMSNRVTEDDKIQTLSDKEFRAFVHMVCLASQANKAGEAEINLTKAERVTGIGRGIYSQVIEKLCKYGICTQSVRDLYATLQNRTEQDNTEQDNTPISPSAHFDFEKAFKLYPLKIKGPDAEKRFRSQMLSEKDESDLHQSINNYRKMLSVETWRRPKQTFSAYLGTKSSGFFWRDFINWTPTLEIVETKEERIARMVRERGGVA